MCLAKSVNAQTRCMDCRPRAKGVYTLTLLAVRILLAKTHFTSSIDWDILIKSFPYQLEIALSKN